MLYSWLVVVGAVAATDFAAATVVIVVVVVVAIVGVLFYFIRHPSRSHTYAVVCMCVSVCEHSRLLRFFSIRFRAVYIFSVFLLCVYLYVCAFSKCVALCMSIIIVERLCHCTATIHTYRYLYVFIICSSFLIVRYF